MKRTILISTAVALMLALTVVVVASAQGTPATTLATPGACQNGNWVDANGDGVCDNAARDGVGQSMGLRGTGRGANFVDANKDDVCDNFVDGDSDGVCDNCGGQQHGARGASGQAMGSGGGRGMQGMGHGMRGGMGRGAQN